MSTPRTDRPARAYPLPRPAPATDEDGDARFTHQLILDVVDVLVAHGYPSPAGHDWGHLVHGLHHTLHAPPSAPAPDTHRVTTLTEIP
jgi:hypothetical protein